MKKIFWLMSIAFSSLLISCSDTKSGDMPMDKKEATAEEKNLKTDAAISDIFMNGKVNGLDSLVDASFVDHTERGTIKGIDSLKANITAMHATMKDMKMETVKSAASGDYVFAWMHYSGTGDGTMMPAGPYDMNSVEVVKFSNGKAVEHWAFVNAQEMMAMMAKMPAGTAVATEPATKK